ncbi:MAG: hypothetical protein JNK64_17235 [Myxococcales bacterium]|nr:hypothetical protein [Myxococcales bacterium]
MRFAPWFALLWVVGCQFERPTDVNFPIDAGIDSPDAAPPECMAGSRSCDADKYTECDATGHFVTYEVPNAGPDGSPTTLTMHDYVCPLGCHATEPRCLDVLPSNGVERAMDAGQVSAAGLDLVIDDPTGDAQLLDDQVAGSTSVTIALASGATISVPARIWSQAGGPDLRVLEVRSFTIRPGSRLKLRGVKPIAIAAHFDIYIGGALDYSGTNNFASMVQAGCDVPLTGQAGAGAGNASSGGASSTGQPGGGALTGSPDLAPLTGGCTAGLGIGGGGLQLVSRTRIVIAGTGSITVAGRRGQALTSGTSFYMAGGGAGGNVVLEAPGVAFMAGSVVVGRGGSGAAGNATTRASADGLAGDADVSATSVPGATCPDCAARGGAGGTETSPAGGAGTGSSTALAGGGGAVGRAVIRTRTIAFPPAASMRIVSLPRQLSTR